jgi:hypothetical protein
MQGRRRGGRGRSDESAALGGKCAHGVAISGHVGKHVAEVVWSAVIELGVLACAGSRDTVCPCKRIQLSTVL